MFVRTRSFSRIAALAWVLAPGLAWAQAGTWLAVDLGLGVDLNDVDFADAEHGCAVGNAATIRCTGTGGETAAEWFAGDVGGVTQNLRGVFLRDASNGWAVGDSGTVLSTADGGHTWTQLDVPAGPPNLRAVWVLDALQAWAATGTMGFVALRTTNGGTSWSPDSIVDGTGQRVVMASASEGWMISTLSTSGRGVIWHTTDGGLNWGEELMTGDLLFGLARSGTGRVFAVGELGTLFRRDGSWGLQETVGATTLQGVAFAAQDPQRAWAVGLGGVIWHTANAGDSWSGQGSGTLQDLLSVDGQDGLRAWAVGKAGTLLVYRECGAGAPCAGGVTGCLDEGQCDLAQGVCGVALADGAECGVRSCQGTDLLHQTCLAGACQPATLLAACTSADPCLDPTCDPAAGCGASPNAAGCDDGDACTQGDQCAGGVCLPGEAIVCQDAEPCTDDGCSPASGCVFTPNSDPCDDGDACTQGDQCAGGGCVSGEAVLCQDGNPCTDDGCQPASGCVFPPNSAACEDGSACTLFDACANGACQPGEAVDCSGLDGVCRMGVCDPDTGGCSAEPAGDGTGCQDGDPCTSGDTCQAGACQPGGPTDCSHLDTACGLGVCQPAQGGCAAQARPDGTGCDDAVDCTRDDACAGGVCAGSPYTCDDGDPCTLDRCDGSGGCAAPAPAPDGTPCGVCLACRAGLCASADQGDACQDGQGCLGLCDQDQVCVIEALCGQVVDGCDLRLDYGPGAEQSLLCRLPEDSLAAAVVVGVGPQAVPGLAPVRVSLTRAFGAPLAELWMLLGFQGSQEGLGLVQDSARARWLPALEGGAAPAELVVDDREDRVLLRLDGSAQAWDALEVDLLLQVRGPGGLPFEVEVWAPCVAPRAEPGCHAGFAPGREDRPADPALGGGPPDLQQVALPVQAWSLAGTYLPLGSEEPAPRAGLGCQCGGGVDGAASAALGLLGLACLARRRRQR
ncbi:MAG TPA: YCF48-related protein [Myxococcota bacterium]|nr:YCF48-related protein [Myxococcota bacterium]HRY94094.1 YCF48-related protein [Myxococcota bacterium]